MKSDDLPIETTIETAEFPVYRSAKVTAYQPDFNCVGLSIDCGADNDGAGVEIAMTHDGVLELEVLSGGVTVAAFVLVNGMWEPKPE